MNQEPNFLANVREELKNGRRWLDRTIVLACACAAGLCVVAFTLMADAAFELFMHIYHWRGGWAVLVWMPAVTVAVVWATRRWAPGAAGSGIPQVMTALEPALDANQRGRFVSLWLSFAKIVLASAGFLAGLSIGREGPSVQVAAGVMHHARRWFDPRSGITAHALLVAGGAAGIAAAFNAPLAGVVFAIEELSRKMESRSSGVIITAIVLAGLMGVSVFGNLSYFGRIQVPRLDWDALVPGLAVALACGVLGGLFAKLLAASLTGRTERMSRLRARFPLRFAACGALVVAVIGLVTGGATFGAGSEAVKHMLAGQADVPALYVTLKFIATWLSAWLGVPGGIFAPSLSIGAGVGHNVSVLLGSDIGPALIAMGMAAFLAAVTQAPLTAFIIVMEMVDGHAMVLSLMAAAMLASLVSRMLARPLYETLAMAMLHNLAPPPPAVDPAPPAPR
ncbi:chloride channel protein [Acidovorax sp. Leaf76]|uniref:chloride channel protein n=1 Tax=unclassified Acidovorax TaxID=2684926 RepID=UPI0006F8B33E|nr:MULTISPECIES: chloride channel protein [unclassified Acidovorax]KQO25394.1 chloride channel protein [Acidovorax sp. Leaf76]KQO30266.1 chloride channel protein [Acidovorax sp. Leaf84]KQS28664.1 chloride channel protein [Acidovorax sp. Leaf191]